MAIDAAAGWNPRYVAYTQAHGLKRPAAMLARDRKRYPGGQMAGFIVWIGERWQEWERLNERKPGAPRSRADHDRFTAWLLELPGDSRSLPDWGELPIRDQAPPSVLTAPKLLGKLAC